MNKTERFDDYATFCQKRKELEDSNHDFVDSYCDMRLGVFRIDYHNVWKESENTPDAPQSTRKPLREESSINHQKEKNEGSLLARLS